MFPAQEKCFVHFPKAPSLISEQQSNLTNTLVCAPLLCIAERVLSFFFTMTPPTFFFRRVNALATSRAQFQHFNRKWERYK